MSSLRLVTWNCRSGPAAARLAELAPLAADIVFLQECAPEAALPLTGPVITRRVNPRKGIALASVSDRYRLDAIEAPKRRRASVSPSNSIAAQVTPVGGKDGGGLAPFFLLGVWAHPPDYADDVLRAVEAHAAALRAGPAVVMGDFNSGTNLGSVAREPSSREHLRLVRELGEHGVDHGQETHATYYHRAKLAEPWHIDFCFVPVSWGLRVTAVHVGGPEEFGTSDHRAVMVEIGAR